MTTRPGPRDDLRQRLMALRLQYGQLTIVVTPAFRLVLLRMGEPLAIVALASQGLQEGKIPERGRYG